MPNLFASQTPRSARNGGPPIRRIEQTERERREREEERIMACGNDHMVAGDLIGVVSMTVLAITVVSALV